MLEGEEVDPPILDPENARLVVLGEASMLVTAMLKGVQRSNMKGSQRIASLAIEAADDDETQDSITDPVVKSLVKLKRSLARGTVDFTNVEYLRPFCEVIKNKDISGPITGLALQSILKFMNYGFIGDNDAAVELVGDSVHRARFVGTDTNSDEVVLFRILTALRRLLVRAFRRLSNESVTELMQSCFRIAFEPRLSELLRKSAEQSLSDSILALFSNLDLMSDTLEEEQKAVNEGEGNGAIEFQEGGDLSRKHYNLICINELFSYMTSLVNPLPEEKNTEAMINVGLHLLTIAFETACSGIGRKACLMGTVKNQLCWNIMMLLQNDRAITSFGAALRLAFLILIPLRRQLKYQLESLLIRMMDIISTGNAPLEAKEITMEYLVAFFRHVPYLPHELYINYDCDPYASNVLQDMLQLFSKNCFTPAPALPHQSSSSSSSSSNANSSTFTTIQMLSLEGVISCLKSVQKSEVGREAYLYYDEGEHPSESIPKSSEEIFAIKKRKQLLSKATEEFNTKPTKGIAYLKENGLIETDADIVAFLRDNQRLDKRHIGDYLATKKNLTILSAFVTSFEFKGLRVDEALRMYLESFRLPGEAPLISMILEQFAHHWHESNGCPFVNEDAAFSLAYAIIMLNVDQHNTNVRRQTQPMTPEEFVSNLRQVNGGGDFDPNMLRTIYHTIKNNEIIMPAEQQGVVREKYIWKCLLRKAATPSSVYFFAVNGEHTPRIIELHQVNGPIFEVLWCPTLAAMTFFLDKINSTQHARLAKLILNTGFSGCAFLCAAYGHLDDLVIGLSKFTAPTQMSDKARLAAECLFSICRDHANQMRSSWSNIVELLLHAYRSKLLDDSLEFDDFALEKTIKLKKRKPNTKSRDESQIGFLSYFSSYFASANNEDEFGPGTSDQTAGEHHNHPNEFARSLLSLMEDSKFYHIESLAEMIKALINKKLEQDDLEEEEDVLILKLELLVQMVIMNRDRVGDYWPQVSAFILRLFTQCGQNEWYCERVISAVFRLAIRFVPRPDEPIHEQSFLLLHHMRVSLHSSVLRKAHTAMALHSFVSCCHSAITRLDDWALILDLILVIGLGHKQRSHGSNQNQYHNSPYHRTHHLTHSGSVESIHSEPEDLGPDAASVMRGYTSDPEMVITPSSVPHPSTNPYQLDPLSHKYRITDFVAYQKCTETLSLIVREIVPRQHLKREDGTTLAQLVIETLRKYVEVSVKIRGNDFKRGAGHGNRSNRQQHKSLSRSSSQIASSDSEDEAADSSINGNADPTASNEATAMKLLDLMHVLHTNVTPETGDKTSDNNSPSPDVVWATIWCPLLQGFALLCCDCRRPVRTTALTFLQKALLLHDLKLLNAHQWENCFNEVLFPLLAKLLEPLNLFDPIGMDETRMRATSLLCKVFLQHLNQLFSLPTFTALWLTVLDFMDKYMKANMQTDLVKEAIPESLKNMLLVMDTAGCFNTALASITWDRINHFLPNLKSEIVPHPPNENIPQRERVREPSLSPTKSAVSSLPVSPEKVPIDNHNHLPATPPAPVSQPIPVSSGPAPAPSLPTPIPLVAQQLPHQSATSSGSGAAHQPSVQPPPPQLVTPYNYPFPLNISHTTIDVPAGFSPQGSLIPRPPPVQPTQPVIQNGLVPAVGPTVAHPHPIPVPVGTFSPTHQLYTPTVPGGFVPQKTLQETGSDKIETPTEDHEEDQHQQVPESHLSPLQQAAQSSGVYFPQPAQATDGGAGWPSPAVGPPAPQAGAAKRYYSPV